MTNGKRQDSGMLYAMANGGFPWVLKDRDASRILLHPGTFGTSLWGSSVGFDIPEDGQDSIRGAFYRGNDLKGAGDGVDVAIILDTEAAHPLWAKHIDSLNPKNAVIDLGPRRLRQGQTVRFLVFSGPQGADGTLDATWLEASIDW